MPAVIPFAVGAIVEGLGFGSLVVGAASLAATLVVGSYQQRQAGKKERDAYNAAQVDRMLNVVTTRAPRELVMGRVRKGGAVGFRGSAGQYKQRFFVHLSLAGHEIDAVEEVWFNDQRVTIDPVTTLVQDPPYMRWRNETGGAVIPAGSTSVVLSRDPIGGSVGAVMTDVVNQTVTSLPVTVSGRTVTIAVQTLPVNITYQYAQSTGYASVWWDLGAPGSVVDNTTKVWFPELFTDAHRGEGVAKLFAVFDWDDSAYPTGAPPNITVVIRGAKLYDPRSGLTVWSENPALMMRHVYQHPKFGKAVVSATEDARIIAAANACDVNQAWNVGGVVQNQKLYRAAMVLPFGADPDQALTDLAQSMAGQWCHARGELYTIAGVYTAAVKTFGDADLAQVRRRPDGAEERDPVRISVHREQAQKFNVVNLRIWDQGRDYKQVGLTPLKGTALITRDGAELAKEIGMPAVFFAPQALHIAGVMMRDARDPMVIEVPLKMSAYPIEIYDTVQFAFSRYGWSSSPKTFLVMARTWDRVNCVVRLTCKEVAAAIYTPDAAFLAQGYALNTALPNPWDIDPPGTLTISSGTSELLIGADGTIITRVRVSWPPIADQRIISDGFVEVQWSDASVGTWTSVIPASAGVSEVFITGVTDGMVILVRARTRNSLASSDWGVQQLHTVQGKSLPPGVPTGLSLTQELVFFRLPLDLDMAGGRIRAVPGMQTAPVFSRGTDVIVGLVRTSPARIEGRLYGVQTIMVVSEDTSGNQSEPAFASLDFGQPDIASAVWDRVFADESFPGIYTDCSLSGGIVVADASASSDVYALGDLYGEPDVYATQFDAMVWQADMVVPPYAGALALTSTLAGNSPLVEYRISGDTITDLYASSDVYASPDLYGAAGAWAAWPGTVVVARATPLDFRVSIGASTQQGTVSEFTLSLVMDPSDQLFSNITLDAAGTRLTPANGSPSRHWISPPRFVYFMPAADGSGSIAGRVLDFSPTLGPLAQFVDNNGNAVTGAGSVKVEGFSDE